MSRTTRYVQNVPGVTLFLRSTKQCTHVSYISFKITPLCNCTLLPATVKLNIPGSHFVKACSARTLHS